MDADAARCVVLNQVQPGDHERSLALKPGRLDARCSIAKPEQVRDSVDAPKPDHRTSADDAVSRTYPHYPQRSISRAPLQDTLSTAAVPPHGATSGIFALSGDSTR